MPELPMYKPIASDVELRVVKPPLSPLAPESSIVTRCAIILPKYFGSSLTRRISALKFLDWPRTVTCLPIGATELSRNFFAPVGIPLGPASKIAASIVVAASMSTMVEVLPSYCQIWCLRDLSCGGGFGLGLLDAVFEIDALDDVGEMIEAAKFAPVLFGALPQFEDHVEHAVAGQTAL